MHDRFTRDLSGDLADGSIDVAGVPRLYTLYRAQAGSAGSGKLVLHASPGVEAYDFTFG